MGLPCYTQESVSLPRSKMELGLNFICSLSSSSSLLALANSSLISSASNLNSLFSDLSLLISVSANSTFFKTYISVFRMSLSFCLSPLESMCLTPVDSASSAYHLTPPYWLPGNRLLDIRQWHHTHCCWLIGSHPKKPGSLSRGCRPPELTALGKHGNQLGGLLEE